MRRRSRRSPGSGTCSAPPIGSFVNIFAPELVVVGGGFGHGRVRVPPPVRRSRSRGARRSSRPAAVRIVPAELGSDAGLIGAGLLAFEALDSAYLMPLAVCATPIGNLEDVTLRVLRELAEADVVLCEDTRRTRGLLERHGIEATLLSYHQHNEAARTAELAAAARGGRADRARHRRRAAGRQRPRRAADRGGARGRGAGDRAARALPPSRPPSSRAASPASGSSSSATCRGARRRSRALWEELARWPHPAVAFESPQRLPATLRSLAAALPGPAGRRLPRADEALRGGRARDRGRGRRAVRGAAEGRDHARARRRARSRGRRGRERRRRRGRRARRGRAAAAAGGRTSSPGSTRSFP